MNELPDCNARHPLYTCQRVGIVGGGFSGVLVLANLVEQADRPLVIECFEPAALGMGVAYSTPEPTHLLNVRAERMGALAGQPDGFYRWLQSAPGLAATQQLGLAAPLAPTSYAPRLLYGYYLRHLLHTTLHKAQAKGITVHLHQATVTDAEPNRLHGRGLLLRSDRHDYHDPIPVDTLVLATGNRAQRPAWLPQPGEAGAHLVVDGWCSPTTGLYSHHVADLPPASEIVIIGTGLTMVDTVLTLQAHGYRGAIRAISRHGWLPAVHAHGEAYPAWAWTLDPACAPRSALGLFQRLRAEISHAATLGYDWRSVIDSLRPVTQQLWQRLPALEKAKFMRRLATLWNIHRHRMAPEVHQQLTQLQQAGRLYLVAGTIDQVTPDEQGLTVAYQDHKLEAKAVCQATLVINCTGPVYASTASRGLLANLRTRSLVTPGPLDLGVAVDTQGSAVGCAPGAIYPIGALLVGELLECTAVPELREQAKLVAEQVLGRVFLPERTPRLAMRQPECAPAFA